MVTDQFGSILQELATALKIPNLKADQNNSCLVKFKGGFRVQIEPDASGKYLVVGSQLGVVSPGRYRDNVFTEALKANGMPHPRYGTFAYSKQNDNLVLFELLPLQDLTGQKVAEFLVPFLEKIKLWQGSILRGEVPVVSTAFISRPVVGMFGLRP